MAEKFIFRGVEFRAGAHLWSNPRLRGTPAEIPVILARPTLFDVVQLADRYPLEILSAANRRLRASREISERQFARTQEILRLVERVRNDGAVSGEALAVAVAVGYEDRGGAEPISEQPHRALENWSPMGLPTAISGTQRYIRFDDVPLEFEVALKRWLRWQLEGAPEKTSLWLVDSQEYPGLSHDGWCAFLTWLTDALLHRLDQMEVGM